MNPDPFDLRRFISAQDPVIEDVLGELRAGHKAGHWMWFVFPQIQGLGFSTMAQRYALASGQEARAYHEHPLLGARLRECTRLVLEIEGRRVEQIFGYPDDLKFRSCMTLFAEVAPEEPIYLAALRKYFAGEPDARTRANPAKR
ncbi:MAG TPA: DUF1810 domain-containing protein [Steroidobacteraceae bacterium]|jgi:uncharacterized protein (DUF1810 family)|nr:DUF1810 domain-containing protein [Steroidobacteraceae bacterium]